MHYGRGNEKFSDLLKEMESRLSVIVKVLTSKSILVEHEYFSLARNESKRHVIKNWGSYPEERVCFGVLLAELEII